MTTRLRVILLTADARRHRYAASQLSQAVSLAGIVSEAKSPLMSGQHLATPDDEVVLKDHFAKRDEVERIFLGEAKFPDVDRLDIAAGSINTAEVSEWIQARKPDVLVLFGTGLVKSPLLTDYEDRLVNVHLGLSPYYRGAGTNFWPLVHGEPECVGATIHLAVPAVDAGPILCQVRPCAASDDRNHEVGTKAMIAAFQSLPRALSLYRQGTIAPRSQDLSIGRVYRKKDFTAEAVRKMRQQLASGMIARYVADAEARCRDYPIVSLPS